MSTDEAVTKDLLETLEDGKDGYAKGADKLAELDESTMASTFREFAQQRTQFGDELQGMANAYGDDPERSGSVVASLHRGWMSLKDALTKDSASSIVDVAVQGDEHAVKEYEKAIGEDISDGLRTVLERQLAEVRRARDVVSALSTTSS